MKTYLTLLIADAVGRGGRFAERKCQSHPVLLLDRENSLQTLSARRSKLQGLFRANNVRIVGQFGRHQAPEIDDPELLRVCEKIKPVIIVDSLVDSPK
jgi:hypothetical protein